MKNLVIGILAHVDAGKTTLSEGLMYTAGAIERLGRVDKHDAHLDTYSLEKERGITIFSKQAIFEFGDSHITLIDTPGHVDFSCEAERALSVQDYCILVVSAADGITSHTKTLWQLLRDRHIPTFIFVNKTDISERKKPELLGELKTVLSSSCVDFTTENSSDFYEDAAGCDEELISEFLDTDALCTQSIKKAIRNEKIFPCYFGSALKMRGVEELLAGIDAYSEQKNYPEGLFGAKIFKIQRDAEGRRLTFAKITGGTLRPKDIIRIRKNGEIIAEKAEELRLFSADKSQPLKVALPGTICAIAGPVSTKAGMGLGFETDDNGSLTPVLTYRLILPEGVNPLEVYPKLVQIGEEDPSLSLRYNAETREIRVNLMGQIQLEVLSRLIKERLMIDVSFDEGQILYKETIADRMYGAGHFEPLCHYAEVHLLLEPADEGCGIVALSECDSDTLGTSWQRLILTHIYEKVHRGTQLGAPLTDVKITLVSGKAHPKHTEGGDFRQATYRAIRQALRKAGTVILEPTFDFRMELPASSLGRAMTDIANMHGSVGAPVIDGSTAILEGNAPVATIRSYPQELRAYTKGEGRITLTSSVYAPCHNPSEVIKRTGYDPDLDEKNPAGSVFCRGGAGYAVPWNEADSLMHAMPKQARESEKADSSATVRETKRATGYLGTVEEDKELMRIFEATYGKIKPRTVAERKENSAADVPTEKKRAKRQNPPGENYVILDGYNVIFAWDELRHMADKELALARDMLIRLMCDYSAFARCKVIVVFDAYKRKDNPGSTEEYGNVTVVYTKEAETADTYIERITYNIAPYNRVRVVTADLVEQYVILGNGALRASVREFKNEVFETVKDIQAYISNN